MRRQRCRALGQEYFNPFGSTEVAEEESFDIRETQVETESSGTQKAVAGTSWTQVGANQNKTWQPKEVCTNTQCVQIQRQYRQVQILLPQAKSHNAAQSLLAPQK